MVNLFSLFFFSLDACCDFVQFSSVVFIFAFISRAQHPKPVNQKTTAKAMSRSLQPNNLLFRFTSTNLMGPAPKNKRLPNKPP